MYTFESWALDVSDFTNFLAVRRSFPAPKIFDSFFVPASELCVLELRFSTALNYPATFGGPCDIHKHNSEIVSFVILDILRLQQLPSN